MSNKNPGPKLIDRRLGSEDPIPVEFRAAMQRIQEEQTNPTDIMPEALSDTIIESRVEWDTRNELKRITVKKVAGNLTLTWYNTGESGQMVQVTRTMFATGSTIDTPSITKSVNVKALGNGWSIQESSVEGSLSGATFTAGFATRYGQTYEPKTGVITKFSETTVAPNTGTGTAGMDITPIDYVRQRNRQWDTAAAITAYLTVARKIVGKTVVDLPDVLVSLVGTANKATGYGAGNHPSSDQAFYYSGGGSGGFSPRAKAQASASCQLDLQYRIRQYRNISVDCTHYYFFLDNGSTMAQVLAKLAGASFASATVLALPVFKTETHQFTIKGQQVSISASADTQVSVAINGNGTSFVKSAAKGSDYSGEIGTSIKTVTTPPTIHGALTITGDVSDSQNVSVSVTANTMAITGSVTVDAITNEPTPVAATAYASMQPTSLSATSVAAVPTTGLYLTDLRGEMSEHGLLMFHAVVVDFANYV